MDKEYVRMLILTSFIGQFVHTAEREGMGQRWWIEVSLFQPAARITLLEYIKSDATDTNLQRLSFNLCKLSFIKLTHDYFI